jgi:hypothetical protein
MLPLGALDQQLIAELMTLLFVDGFEIVDV